ncbi:MAG: sulfatase [Planctomycetota bacterium]
MRVLLSHCLASTVRYCACLLWVALALVAVEYAAISILYRDLGEHTAGGPVLGILTLLGGSALSLGLVALAAGLLTGLFRMLFSEKAAATLGTAIVAFVGPLLLGITAVRAVFPDRSIIGSRKMLFALALVVACALVAAVVAALWARSRAGRQVRNRTVVAGAALWVLGLAGSVAPFGFRVHVEASSHPRLACRRPAGTPAPLEGVPVVLITVDTLRASHMSLHGYPRPTTPGIDERAAEGTVFTRAIAPKSSTAPAVASLMTGLYPDAHQVLRNGIRLSENLTTLGERMADAGYRCVGFTTNPYVSGRTRGFRQGFHHWRGYGKPPYSSKDIVSDAMAWIRKSQERKLFLWVHVADPHTPYRPPAPYDRMFREDELSGRFRDVSFEIVSGRTELGEVNPAGTIGKGWEELGLDERDLESADFYVSWYDGEIAFTDEWVTRLLELVNKELPGALVLFTSDHGESMVEHDHFFFHSRFCYDTTAHVPLVVWNPRARGPEKADRLVSLVDVFPTLCDLVGIVPPERLEGRSFADVWHPDLDARREGSEREGVFVSARSSVTHPIRGIRTSRWKLILTPRRVFSPLDMLLEKQLGLRSGATLLGTHLLRVYATELYDLEKDPGETKNLAGQHPQVESRLRRQLVRSVQMHRLDRLALNVHGLRATFDEDELAELRALGYLR